MVTQAMAKSILIPAMRTSSEIIFDFPDLEQPAAMEFDPISRRVVYTGDVVQTFREDGVAVRQDVSRRTVSFPIRTMQVVDAWRAIRRERALGASSSSPEGPQDIPRSTATRLAGRGRGRGPRVRFTARKSVIRRGSAGASSSRAAVVVDSLAGPSSAPVDRTPIFPADPPLVCVVCGEADCLGARADGDDVADGDYVPCDVAEVAPATAPVIDLTGEDPMDETAEEDPSEDSGSYL